MMTLFWNLNASSIETGTNVQTSRSECGGTTKAGTRIEMVRRACAGEVNASSTAAAAATGTRVRDMGVIVTEYPWSVGGQHRPREPPKTGGERTADPSIRELRHHV